MTTSSTLAPEATGEATGVVSGTQQAAAIKLRVIALRESTAAQVADLQKSVETLEASAVGMKMDQDTMGAIAQAREALASMGAAVTSAGEEVTSTMTSTENGFAKHLPGVELNAAVGGLAEQSAYAGN